jgi:hypothetical protein
MTNVIEAELKSKQINQKKFTQLVEKLVVTNGGDLIDAILMICEGNNIDPSDVSRYMSKPLKYKFEAYASNLKLIQSTGNKLPI